MPDAPELPTADREQNRRIAEEQNAAQAVVDAASARAGRTSPQVASDANVALDAEGRLVDPNTHFDPKFHLNRQRAFTTLNATLLDIINKLRANPGQAGIEVQCGRLETMRAQFTGQSLRDASLDGVTASRATARGDFPTVEPVLVEGDSAFPRGALTDAELAADPTRRNRVPFGETTAERRAREHGGTGVPPRLP